MINRLYKLLLCLFSILLLTNNLFSQEQSIAREWNEEVLYAISADFARPTVHSRNLFHTSIAMYDAWAAYETGANLYFLGQNLNDFIVPFDGIPLTADTESAQNEAISFAVFRLIEHRYATSPGLFSITDSIQSLMEEKGYDHQNTSFDYQNGGPAELGNYLAKMLIEYGFQDGANELNDYANQYYAPINPPIEVENPGNPDIFNPDRWQQITLTESIDQSGEVVASTPEFLGPEWGDVHPFSMSNEDITILNRDGHNYNVYFDPGNPALYNDNSLGEMDNEYKWNFMLVPIWASHLTTDDDVIWDISPKATGNIQSYPENQEEMVDFYNLLEGGDSGTGYDLNPITGAPYESQFVKRGDYARVLAEFWADGPNSVTPPGHWFDLLNGVADHPLFERKWKGIGPEMENLEYDVKSYLAMGGAMHDAAIAAWSIKGYYDYIRPVSAIRYLTDNGQCSEPGMANYNIKGAPLIPGYIELVENGDPLAGNAIEHVGKIKLYTWKGPDYIDEPDSDVAGVGWILAENWWPYQRPSFVTPPFAGYVSGHSTFSRTAAELMTLMTGSAYFPGGMSGYILPQNEFLVFEDGPSETIELQWATYRDASDQCSLSRIWGGIHPPIDDIPGRKIGMELGPNAFNFADNIVSGSAPYVQEIDITDETININDVGTQFSITAVYDQEMNPDFAPEMTFIAEDPSSAITMISSNWETGNTWTVTFQVSEGVFQLSNIAFSIQDAESIEGKTQNPHLEVNAFVIDTKRPGLTDYTPSNVVVNDEMVANLTLEIEVKFDEACDTNLAPTLTFESINDISNTLAYSVDDSYWETDSLFLATYELADAELEEFNIALMVSDVNDLNGNLLEEIVIEEFLQIDTKNPTSADFEVNNQALSLSDLGGSALVINITFPEPMDQISDPSLSFPEVDPTENSLFYNTLESFWIDEYSCQVTYDLLLAEEELMTINISLANFADTTGNTGAAVDGPGLFTIDTKRPEVENYINPGEIISDLHVGSSGLNLQIQFSEPMDTDQYPLMIINNPDAAESISYEIGESSWQDAENFNASFLVEDNNVEISDIAFTVGFATDASGNEQNSFTSNEIIQLDTKNPEVLSVSANDYLVSDEDIGEDAINILMIFDEEMDENSLPTISFIPQEPATSVLVPNENFSFWLNAFTYNNSFDVLELEALIENVGLHFSEARDIAGNEMYAEEMLTFFTISLEILSVNNRFSQTGIALFPSPLMANEQLKLLLGESQEEVQINMYDLNGKDLATWSFDQMLSGVHSFSLPKLESGLYVVNFTSQTVQTRLKIVVKN